MIINRIVKKGKKDVTIQFDDDKFLILALEVFLKSGLKKGDDISENRFSLFIEHNKLFHIKQRAFRLLGRRQHSASELRRKLWNKDYEQKLIDEIISDLSKNGYIDDGEFIREFVAEKSRTKSWSIKKIKSELIKRGVAYKLIDETLNNRPKEDDFENALQLAKKKYDQLVKKKLEPKELRNKLYAFLFSKGFEYEMIKEVIVKIMKANPHEL
jgi:regulatory protein